MRPVFLDTRSALSCRTTGWERYARELWSGLQTSELVEGLNFVPDKPFSRMVQDWIHIRKASSRHKVSHFPTYPPAAGARGGALVFTLHDLTLLKFPDLGSRLGRAYYRPMMERAIRTADVVVVDTHAIRDELLDACKRRTEVRVISPGVRPVLANRLDRARDKPFILFVGTIEPRKNLGRLVEAYRRSSICEDVELVVAGRRGWGDLPSGIVHVDTPDEQTLGQLYSSAVAFVCPSLYEGFGFPVLESLAHSTPVLCSDIPVFREVAGGHATYFDPLCVESICSALEAAPGLARPVDGPSYVAARFSWDETAARHLRLYEELM